MTMRTTRFLLCGSMAALLSAGMISAYAAEGAYYDPSNAASSSGKTTGFELYRTIGCPGKGLLDAPCQVPPEPAPAPAPAPAPVAEPAPAPAPVAEPAPA